MEANSSNTRATRRLSGWIDRTVNFLPACLLFPFALLIISVVYLVYRLRVGSPRPPFLYSGTRLGRNRKPFTLYKIRTLRPAPDGDTPEDRQSPGACRKLPLGKFLQESRLDELPQLWNVLRGDMNLVGPRPLCPALCEQLKTELPNFDVRFRVKPGLTGFAQFLIPSGSPKRIRFAIDQYYISRGPSPGRNLFLIAWTAREVIRKTLGYIFRKTAARMNILRYRGRIAEQRRLPRKRFRHIWIQLSDACFSRPEASPAGPAMSSLGPGGEPLIHIYDINAHALSFYSSRHHPLNSTLYFYLVGCKECEAGKKKKARCIGTVYKQYPEKPGSGTGTRYVVFYEPLSPRHRYLIDHYVLHETVA